MSAEITVDDARAVLVAQPFSVLLGAQLESFGEGSASLSVEIRDELRQQFGFVHGGVYAYLADNVLTFAGGSVLGPAVLTASVNVTYLRPAREGTLIATARVVSSDERRATCECEIVAVSDGERIVCATAEGVIARRTRTND